MTISEKASKKLGTQVQGLETKYLNAIPKNFRSYSTGDNSDEVIASSQLYRAIDRVSGKQNSENFDGCRSHAWFTVSIVSRKVRVASNSCRLRWCPLCSKALSRYRSHSISDWLEGQAHPRFLTLTLKHSNKPLVEQIKDIYYYFRQLRKIEYFKSVVSGGIWFFQIKRSQGTGQWHPHLHCLVLGKYIVHPRLSAIWEKITGGSTVIDIRTIREEKQIAEYVARYSARPAMLKDYTFDDQLEIFSAMHRRRLCGTWGTGKECSLSNTGSADLSEWRKVGSWKTIVSHAPFVQYAKLVFKCWLKGTAMPDFISLTGLEQPEHLFSDTDLENAVLLDFYESG